MKEMAQPLRPTAVLVEDLGQVPAPTFGGLQPSNSSSRPSDALFWLLDEDWSRHGRNKSKKKPTSNRSILSFNENTAPGGRGL